jgi:hypothetical protein
LGVTGRGGRLGKVIGAADEASVSGTTATTSEQLQRMINFDTYVYWELKLGFL